MNAVTPASVAPGVSLEGMMRSAAAVAVAFACASSARCAPAVPRCLRHPDRTPVRSIALFLGRVPGKQETYTARMKRKIDTDRGRHQYARRLGTVEPVFANINHVRHLKRFSLRGAAKVNSQWLLYCLVHNIGKLQRYGGMQKRSAKSRATRH